MIEHPHGFRIHAVSEGRASVALTIDGLEHTF